jgi:hypothetical protein
MYELTQEQKFILKRVELEAKDLNREELVEALLGCWEVRFQLKQSFMEFSRGAGIVFRVDEQRDPFSPDSMEDLESIFGYEPTEEEAVNYIKDVYESATMELDMDEIVLGVDNE